jgi:hypothetical protein
VPAGGIGKEKAVSFPEAPFTKVMQLVGFALPDEDNRKPAAALTAAAAGAGCRGRLGGFHGDITVLRMYRKSVRGNQINMP